MAGVNTEKRNTLATLFGFGKKKDRDEDEEADIPARAPQARTPAQVQTAAAVAPASNPPVRQNLFGWNQGAQPAAQAQQPIPSAPAAVITAPVPMPKAKPATPVQMASAAPVPPAPEKPVRPAPGSLYALAGAPGNDPNDVINARGYWRGLPEAPVEASAARRVEPAAADPQVDLLASRSLTTTGSIGPNIGPWTRDVPGDVATAYASASEAAPKADLRPARAAPVGAVTSNAIPRNAAAAAGTTVALKSTPQRPSEIQTAQPASASLPVTGRPADEPWLRAIIATPSVQDQMTVTLMGAADMRALQPLLRKPASMLMLTFSADPYAGLNHQRFEGSAIVFLASAMPGRTAALR